MSPGSGICSKGAESAVTGLERGLRARGTAQRRCGAGGRGGGVARKHRRHYRQRFQDRQINPHCLGADWARAQTGAAGDWLCGAYSAADVFFAPVASRIARVMMDGAPRALTMGATHFHTRSVRPGWSNRFPRTAAIGAHLFYRQP